MDFIRGKWGTLVKFSISLFVMCKAARLGSAFLLFSISFPFFVVLEAKRYRERMHGAQERSDGAWLGSKIVRIQSQEEIALDCLEVCLKKSFGFLFSYL